MSANDGGPAFPTEPNTQPGYYQHHGMSLRDYFAAQALPLVIDVVGAPDVPAEVPTEQVRNAVSKVAARWAYALADAMLAERAKASPSKAGGVGE